VLGQGWRGYIALYALLVIPVLSTDSFNQKRIAGFAVLMVLIVLNPITSVFLYGMSSSLSWRVFWVVPFPLIVGLAGAGLAGSSRWGLAGSVMLAVIFALVPDNWTLSSKNHTQLDFSGYKVGGDYEIAEAVVAATPPGGLVLAPWNVSCWIPLFSKHPRLVGVRPLYLTMIVERALGEQEADKRRMMLNFIEGTAGAERQFPEVMEEIQQRSITTIVVPHYLSWRRNLGEELKKLGYLRHKVKDYELWIVAQR
jgi:hypothetical protein